MKLRGFRIRSLVVAACALIMGAVFLTTLYDAQIRNGIDIDASTAANTIATTETVEAARGPITDRYGRVLVSNQTIYNVNLD
ncbi:MAG: penicillin-binding protein, partial [Oscillospiraceae bacterium]|nr:penicillin-binding protein [Oscillospiraceae bacterium]